MVRKLPQIEFNLTASVFKIEAGFQSEHIWVSPSSHSLCGFPSVTHLAFFSEKDLRWYWKMKIFFKIRHCRKTSKWNRYSYVYFIPLFYWRLEENATETASGCWHQIPLKWRYVTGWSQRFKKSKHVWATSLVQYRLTPLILTATPWHGRLVISVL